MPGSPDPSRFRRRPSPPLAPYVELFWAVDEQAPAARGLLAREHVLPTARMHLVFRLNDPLRVFAGAEDDCGEVIGSAVVGGARDGFYVRDVSRPLSSVGAQLRSGAAEVLFGPGAGELAGRHTPLDAIWGGEVESLRDRLASLPTPESRVDALERALLARVGMPRALHPAVAQALHDLRLTPRVGRIVRATGYSHRTLLLQFRRAVGLGPKEYCRVLRFNRALRSLAGGRPLADVAAAAGYADQAHFTREFRACAGVPPSWYRRARPDQLHHLRRTPQR